MSNRLGCEWTYSETVNYAMQQNHVPVVRKIVLTNAADEDLRGVTVKLTAEPQYAYEWGKTFDILPAGRPLDLGTVNLQMSASFLGELSERVSGCLVLTVSQGEELLLEERGEITVLAFDEWSGLAVLPEMTAAFVTPNHPQVSRVVREAADILEKWCGSSSITAYQSKDPNRVRLQAAAIYAAVQNRGIAYNAAPPSFELIGQRVRLPETIFAQLMGNCLDLSLLYAACLEASGLHPLVIFTEGHAFVGVWLVEETFPESVQDDVSLLTKRLAPGINEICVIEATAMAERQPVSFDEAAGLAAAHLDNPDKFDCLVDVHRARAASIRPLPLRMATPAGWVIEPETQTEAGSPTAPEMLDIPGKPAEADSIPITRQKQWERRLLDLSLRNTLLNFRLSKSSVPLITVQLGDLEDALAEREEFQLLAKPADWQDDIRSAAMYQSVNNAHPLAQLLREEFGRKRLRSDLNAAELDRRLVHLYRSARVSLEENGANTLYLALGLLKWYETPVSEMPRYAPLALVPIDILRKSSRLGFVIRARDEEPQMNITLLEMLRQDFGIGIGGLDPLPRDEKGIDLRQVFNVFRHALIQVPRWDIEETASLGLFSFGQFVMWNDIRTRADTLAENKVVASLMDGKLQWQEQADEAEKMLDEEHPSSLAIPISADSSQLEAVRAAAAGQTFVLHGPPGTGKSQTITNMIASALANGKRVLFVAEKMAALSVVQRRLEQIGLGPFCLELHSNKSTKKAVLGQLSDAIETPRLQPPDAWSAQAERLAGLRAELNGYVSALHRKHQSGYSLFDAISGYEQAGPGPDAVRFDPASIAGLTPDKVTLWHDLATQIKAAGRLCGNPHLHPLSDIGCTTYSQSMKSEAEALLQRYIPELSERQEALHKAASLLGLESVSLNCKRTSLLVRLCDLMTRVPDVKPALLQAPNIEEAASVALSAAKQGERRDRIRHKVCTDYKPDVLRFDAQLTLSEWTKTELAWFMPKWLGQNRICKLMRSMAVQGKVPAKEQVKNHLTDIISWQEEERKLKEAGVLASPLFGPSLWNEERGEWDAVAAACDWALQLHQLLAEWYGGNITEACRARSGIGELLANGRNHFLAQSGVLQQAMEFHARVDAGEQELCSLLNIDPGRLVSMAGDDDWHAFIREKAKGLLANLDGLRAWCAWRRVRGQAEEAGLLPFIKPYESGELSNDQLIAAFERGLYKACANTIIALDEELSAFSGSLFEDTVNRFKEADRRFSELTRQEIAARLSSRVPQMSQEAAQSSEAGILQRAIRSGGRSVSIRRLFEQIPNLLPRLTPCMLMSPISVAQYLDPKGTKFDLVIFDEASQVPTAEAVGALARGTQAVVVGDPKQLPPTSFFSKTNAEFDEEDQAVLDMESILDDCLALGMTQRYLSWHYRSRHESLIAFSNAHYYDGKLMTFPSPEEPVSNVKWHPVEGFYDRGRSKQNRAEGVAVVAEITRRLKDPELRKQSIGVVTFSSIQQTLIEDLLDEAFKKEPDLELQLTELPEPVFVKNLENVQGDERDVILFSVGYGPDASGKVSLNFGPLNRQGGWRRLNVAVSRARHEMHVFSTLRSHHLSASRIGAEGVLGLKAFLDYAEKGKQVLPAGEASKQEALISDIHRSLAGEIKALGYDTDIYVGTSGYRVDIGVKDPANSGQYMLGVLLDGPMYQNAGSARDREILRYEVLQQLGWSLHRIWSPDWWEDRESVIRSLGQAIEREKAGKFEAARSAQETTVVQEQQESASVARPAEERALKINAIPEQEPNLHGMQYYKTCLLESVDLGTDMFYSADCTGLIIEQIKTVIHEEGPISRSLLAKRILQAWGIARRGARLDQRFTELLAMLNFRRTETDGAVFFWPKGVEPNQYDIYRVAEDEAQRRAADDLPSEEVAAAVKSVLAAQISLPLEDLVKQVVKRLGYARSGQALEKAARNGISFAVERGSAVIDEQQRVVAG
ncbi:DUF3320 domain-containing protein [Paenibacillus tarimensis]